MMPFKLPKTLLELLGSTSADDHSFLSLCEYFLDTPYGQTIHLNQHEPIPSTNDYVQSLCDDEQSMHERMFEKLDCVTYIEVLLALRLTQKKVAGQKSSDAWVNDQFKKDLTYIRYKTTNASFFDRNHFASLDWLPRLYEIGLCEDMTASTAKNIGIACKKAHCEIDKMNWLLSHQDVRALLERHPNDHDLFESLVLKTAPNWHNGVAANIHYLSIADCLEYYDIFCQILPERCVLSVIRPNWDLREKIGTHLNVSHHMLSHKKPTGVDIYHSSMAVTPHRVVQQNLQQYLESYVDHESIQGIHIAAVNL